MSRTDETYSEIQPKSCRETDAELLKCTESDGWILWGPTWDGWEGDTQDWIKTDTIVEVSR